MATTCDGSVLADLVKQQKAIFSTNLGEWPAREAIARTPVIIRSDPTEDKNDMIDDLWSRFPEECKKITSPMNIYDYFDHYDIHIHGSSMIVAVLEEIAKSNLTHHHHIMDFVEQWWRINGESSFSGGHNKTSVDTVDVFTPEEKSRYGENFLCDALPYIIMRFEGVGRSPSISAPTSLYTDDQRSPEQSFSAEASPFDSPRRNASQPMLDQDATSNIYFSSLQRHYTVGADPSFNIVPFSTFMESPLVPLPPPLHAANASQRTIRRFSLEFDQPVVSQHRQMGIPFSSQENVDFDKVEYRRPRGQSITNKHRHYNESRKRKNDSRPAHFGSPEGAPAVTLNHANFHVRDLPRHTEREPVFSGSPGLIAPDHQRFLEGLPFSHDFQHRPFAQIDESYGQGRRNDRPFLQDSEHEHPYPRTQFQHRQSLPAGASRYGKHQTTQGRHRFRGGLHKNQWPQQSESFHDRSSDTNQDDNRGSQTCEQQSHRNPVSHYPRKRRSDDARVAEPHVYTQQHEIFGEGSGFRKQKALVPRSQHRNYNENRRQVQNSDWSYTQHHMAVANGEILPVGNSDGKGNCGSPSDDFPVYDESAIPPFAQRQNAVFLDRQLTADPFKTITEDMHVLSAEPEVDEPGRRSPKKDPNADDAVICDSPSRDVCHERGQPTSVTGLAEVSGLPGQPEDRALPALGQIQTKVVTDHRGASSVWSSITYKLFTSKQYQPEAKLWVSNIPQNVTVQRLAQLFGSHGPILTLTALAEESSPLHAWIIFENPSHAADAVKNLNGLPWKDLSSCSDSRSKIVVEIVANRSRRNEKSLRGIELTPTGKELGAYQKIGSNSGSAEMFSNLDAGAIDGHRENLTAAKDSEANNQAGKTGSQRVKRNNSLRRKTATGDSKPTARKNGKKQSKAKSQIQQLANERKGDGNGISSSSQSVASSKTLKKAPKPPKKQMTPQDKSETYSMEMSLVTDGSPSKKPKSKNTAAIKPLPRDTRGAPPLIASKDVMLIEARSSALKSSQPVDQIHGGNYYDPADQSPLNPSKEHSVGRDPTPRPSLHSDIAVPVHSGESARGERLKEKAEFTARDMNAISSFTDDANASRSQSIAGSIVSSTGLSVVGLGVSEDEFRSRQNSSQTELSDETPQKRKISEAHCGVEIDKSEMSETEQLKSWSSLVERGETNDQSREPIRDNILVQTRQHNDQLQTRQSYSDVAKASISKEEKISKRVPSTPIEGSVRALNSASSVSIGRLPRQSPTKLAIDISSRLTLDQASPHAPAQIPARSGISTLPHNFNPRNLPSPSISPTKQVKLIRTESSQSLETKDSSRTPAEASTAAPRDRSTTNQERSDNTEERIGGRKELTPEPNAAVKTPSPSARSMPVTVTPSSTSNRMKYRPEIPSRTSSLLIPATPISTHKKKRKVITPSRDSAQLQVDEDGLSAVKSEGKANSVPTKDTRYPDHSEKGVRECTEDSHQNEDPKEDHREARNLILLSKPSKTSLSVEEVPTAIPLPGSPTLSSSDLAVEAIDTKTGYPSVYEASAVETLPFVPRVNQRNSTSRKALGRRSSEDSKVFHKGSQDDEFGSKELHSSVVVPPTKHRNAAKKERNRKASSKLQSMQHVVEDRHGVQFMFEDKPFRFEPQNNAADLVVTDLRNLKSPQQPDTLNSDQDQFWMTADHIKRLREFESMNSDETSRLGLTPTSSQEGSDTEGINEVRKYYKAKDKEYNSRIRTRMVAPTEKGRKKKSKINLPGTKHYLDKITAKQQQEKSSTLPRRRLHRSPELLNNPEKLKSFGNSLGQSARSSGKHPKLSTSGTTIIDLENEAELGSQEVVHVQPGEVVEAVQQEPGQVRLLTTQADGESEEAMHERMGRVIEQRRRESALNKTKTTSSTDGYPVDGRKQDSRTNAKEYFETKLDPAVHPEHFNEGGIVDLDDKDTDVSVLERRRPEEDNAAFEARIALIYCDGGRLAQNTDTSEEALKTDESGEQEVNLNVKTESGPRWAPLEALTYEKLDLNDIHPDSPIKVSQDRTFQRQDNHRDRDETTARVGFKETVEESGNMLVESKMKDDVPNMESKDEIGSRSEAITGEGCIGDDEKPQEIKPKDDNPKSHVKHLQIPDLEAVEETPTSTTEPELSTIRPLETKPAEAIELGNPGNPEDNPDQTIKYRVFGCQGAEEDEKAFDARMERAFSDEERRRPGFRHLKKVRKVSADGRISWEVPDGMRRWGEMVREGRLSR